jgi:HEAT repeat protein
MTTKHNLFLCLFLFLLGWTYQVEACVFCWTGYGKGDERLNKPLADIRIIYEKEGRGALPYIRQTLQTSTDPLVIRRAATYIVALNDRDSIPLLEDMLRELTKRVSFSSFGQDTYNFQGRLAVAHALVKLGTTEVADEIWGKYERLEFSRKSEVPYVLNALDDPQLDERLLQILDREEDHQLKMAALDAFALGGSPKALPALEARVAQWNNVGNETIDKANDDPVYYSVLRVKGEQAIFAIEDRCK